MVHVTTVDAHAGGARLRLVVDGFPAPVGRTMREKREWANGHLDHLRRLLLHEPRGHPDLVGAALTEPVALGSHAGIIFMDRTGFSGLSSHGILAAAKIAVERGLVVPGGDRGAIQFDTEAGALRARVDPESPGRVACQYVPSFVQAAGLIVAVGHRQVPADVVFGGAFYAVVDSESAGLPLTGGRLPEIRRAGVGMMEALTGQHHVVHPVDGVPGGVQGVVFTSAAGEGTSGLRSVTVFADGQIDPSPSETGTAALTALLSAMDLLPPGSPFEHEGLSGARLWGRAADRTVVGDYEAVVPQVEGTAWITGDCRLVADERDELGDGFSL